MHILLDVDNVVADFVGGVCNLVKDYDRSKANHFDWFDTAYGSLGKDQVRTALSHSTSFWASLPLVENAKEGVAFLREQGHQITWCTAPYSTKYGWCDDRRTWLNKHFDIGEKEEHIIFTHAKRYIKADCLIDDLLKNVMPWKEENPQGLGLIFTAEHNRQNNVSTVDWKQIMLMRCFQRDQAT